MTRALTLHDVFDADALAAALNDGYVKRQRHAELPYVIYNYTEKAQYESAWTPVTLACRGLIVDERDGGVVARPYRKFFNHDQPDAPPLDVTAPAAVTDKLDGSLGILYREPSGAVAVATRGSFASTQAVRATGVLRARYPDFTPPAGLTVLVEVIYPANRIVLDYGGLDDLVLIGAVDNATGRGHGPEAVPEWPGPVVERMPYPTLAAALAAPPRDNREGMVVHFPDTDHRVKIKYAEYVRLHRLVTGLNARMVWEAVVAGALDDIVAGLPDEFHLWVRTVAGELTATVTGRAAAVEAAYRELVAALPAGWQRRDFARLAVTHQERGCLFLRLDGKDYRPLLWQEARPAADWTPAARRTVET